MPEGLESILTTRYTRITDLAPFASVFRQHLQEIIDSSSFRGSHRCQQFLQYVVIAALEGHSDRLKERSVGVELFNRPASYRTGDDAIVRVTASDVRKRLHHFYAETSTPIRIDLPPGSYSPAFYESGGSAAVSSKSPPEMRPATSDRFEPRRQRPKLPRLMLFVAVILCFAAATWLISRQNSGISPHRVLPWSAMLGGEHPIQIVFADPDVSAVQTLLGHRVSLTDYAKGRFWRDDRPLSADLQKIFTGAAVPSVDVAITQAISGFTRDLRGRTARSLRLANFKTDDNFVVLGSPRSNPWHELFHEQLDFVFAYDEASGTEVIRNKDVRAGEEQVYIPTAMGGETGRAYAIVAFVKNPDQQGHVLLLAGTNAEGTEAAGEFVTNLDLLSRTLRSAGIDPSGRLRYFEVLLSVRTLAGSVSKTEAIACHALNMK